MSETENPKRIYIVVHQNDEKQLLQKLYAGHEIVWVYYKEVLINTKKISEKKCCFFSFKDLPDEIMSCEDYEKICNQMKKMVEECLNDKNNDFIVWNFIPSEEHFGAYIHMLHMLEERGKVLIFNVSFQELQESMEKHTAFSILTKKHIEKGLVKLAA